jgi:hypothetical protein
MATKLFVRRRDGRIEVRLNDVGRAMVRAVFAHVLAGERDPEHEWHPSLNPPINPSSDDDDPLSTLARQSETASNAELAALTFHEQYLTDSEAWAWLSTLQVALRSTAVANGILSDEKLESASTELLDEIHILQQLLFDLAGCF